MLKRYLKLNQGMTMGMVLIIMSILSILGVATLSLAVSIYRVQISDKNVKATFYVADSALDQAYGLIGSQIKKAIANGNEAVNQKIEQLIEEERIDELIDPEHHVNHWLNADGTLNEEYLKEQLQTNTELIGIMQRAYIDYLNDYYYLNPPSDNELYLPASYTEISGVKPESIMIDDSESGIIPFENSELPSTKMVIPLLFKINNTLTQVVQQISAQLNISVPPKIIGYQTVSNNIFLQDQPLWRTALASYQDINLSGASINVQGDVFAAGTKPPNLKDLPAFGGITAGKTTADTNVLINGNVCSYANVQVNSNRTNICIKNNVFADNLVIQKDTHAGSIEIDQNAYTKDDIEINGSTATLRIKGNYNGYSGGEEGHDMSSSIVINSPDINQENGSKVQVDGDSFFAGTVYINSGDPDYQTGESLAIDGNYRAYGYLPQGDENKYTFRKVGNSLMLIDKWKASQTPLNVKDKALHFNSVYHELVSKSITDFLNTGFGNSSIVLGGDVLSLGSYIKNGEIEYSEPDIGEYNNKQQECQTAVNTYVTNPFAVNLADRVIFSEIPENSEPSSQINNNFNKFKGLLTSRVHDVALLGTGGDSTGLPDGTIIIDASSHIGGLILTTGKVYIRGKVDYFGSIIAGNNIAAEDNNPKNFYAKENLVKQIIAENSVYDLNSLFIPPANTVSTPFTYDVYGEVPVNSQYADYLSVTNWKKN